MIKVYIHRSMFCPNVVNILDQLVIAEKQPSHDLGYVCLVGNSEVDFPKAIIFRSDVVINNGVVWKTLERDTHHHNTNGIPEISYSLFKNRVMGGLDLGETIFRNVISAYVPCPKAAVIYGYSDIQQLARAFCQSLMGDLKVYGDFDDFLLAEDGTSKSSDGVIMLSDELQADIKGRDYMLIGGSLFVITRVGAGFTFDHVSQDKILEI